MTVVQLFETFLTHQEVRGKPKTVKFYRDCARIWTDALGGRSAARLTLADVNAVVADRREAGRAPGTCNGYLRTLKAALRFGKRQGHLRAVPVEIQLLKVTRTKVRAFDREEVGRLLASAGRRERMLLALLGATGMRVDEALHLKWADFNPLEGAILISAKPEVGWSPKSHAEREVFLGEEIIQELETYRKGQVGAADSDWIFQTRTGARLKSTFRAVRKVFKDCGLYEHRKLHHQLRRSAASSMLVAGTDLNTVREILGHASITTTQLYLASNRDAKRAAARRSVV